MTSFLVYFYAESPLHAGASESGDGLDLPIQREAGTGYPVIWGQSLKGALRQLARDQGLGPGHDESPQRSYLEHAFGPDLTGDGRRETDPAAGVVTVGDAQLVAMPVPTLQHTFAWATSGLALGRLARKYQRIGRAADLPSVPDEPYPGTGYATCDSWTTSGGAEHVLGPCVVPLTQPEGTDGTNPLARWASLLRGDALGAPDVNGTTGSSETPAGHAPMHFFGKKMSTDLLLLHSDVMDQVLRESTEQSVQVQLSPETKTVRHGPFTSEYLPAESLLASVVTFREERGQLDPESYKALQDIFRELLNGRVLQLGGHETTGKGLVWAHTVGGED
ncbi:CRISPR-associated Cmr4 family protein [Haloactinospora alba]|uniref:CRISPR-associated Cmr4 family protein n=1 Tax=Haloactinospora alba TaxID=405555 RepID=A0A543N9W2_9ACTN|nr:type III-B CRISPR module RAMP protein Cmr4 [Haloactinospora alba]TQN28626.1 CRISPR-associated Cmr4 family protein [Haloactinospora alba]